MFNVYLTQEKAFFRVKLKSEQLKHSVRENKLRINIASETQKEDETDRKKEKSIIFVK